MGVGDMYIQNLTACDAFYHEMEMLWVFLHAYAANVVLARPVAIKVHSTLDLCFSRLLEISTNEVMITDGVFYTKIINKNKVAWNKSGIFMNSRSS